ncbi:hypothetical protein JCM10213_003439 [Rhodosporidiobolus nylandii]
MSSDDTSLYDFLSFFVYDPVPTHYSYDAVLAYRRKPAAHWSAIEERWAKLVRAVDELETPKGHLNAMEIWAEEKLRGKLLQERDDLYGSGYGLVFARERSLEYIKKMGVSERDFEAYLSERPSTWVAVSTVVQEIKLRRQTACQRYPFLCLYPRPLYVFVLRACLIAGFLSHARAGDHSPLHRPVGDPFQPSAFPCPLPSASTTTSYRHHTLLVHWSPFGIMWEISPHCLEGRPEPGEERQRGRSCGGAADAQDGG